LADDFALIAINNAFNSWITTPASATLPYWCGPTGGYEGNTALIVGHFGYGAVVGTGGTPRAGLVRHWDINQGTAFSWAGVAAPGDSGSGAVVVDLVPGRSRCRGQPHAPRRRHRQRYCSRRRRHQNGPNPENR
jgi:hypothetical protein